MVCVGPPTICLFWEWKSNDSEFLQHWTLQHIKFLLLRMSLPAEFLLLWTSYCAEFLQHWTSRRAEFLQHWTSRHAEFLHAWAVKPCRISAALDATPCRISAALDVKPYRISALQFVIPCQIKMKKKNRLNILRVKIKDFIVPFQNVQSIICTLTRVNNQRSKKLNICKSKMHLRLTLRWIIQNVALLKYIFLIRENWRILLLLHRRNFRVFSGIVLLWGQHFTLSGKKHDILRNRYEKYA